MFSMFYLIKAYEKACEEFVEGDNMKDAAVSGTRAAILDRAGSLRRSILGMTGTIRDMEILAELTYFTTWESLRSLQSSTKRL